MAQIKYTVKKGDTLWDIAVKYLGKGIRYKEIYNDNKSILKSPESVSAGQVLIINTDSGKKSGSTTSKTSSTSKAEKKKDDELTNYVNRYKKPQVLDRLQHDPSRMKIIDFKQDYTVLIRKKHYYAITQKSDEEYIKIFQLNNFTGINTSNSVYGKGTATVNLKGGTRVVVANKDQVTQHNWKNFQDVLNGWNSINDDSKSADYDGVRYENLMKTREHKYSWAYAEKCDIEPMDEIFIFSKTHNKDQGAGHKFVQIFFGYISQVSKNYSAGPQGATMTIAAEDHLKLLQLSYVANRVPKDMATGGTSFSYNGLGNFIVEDDYLYQGINLDVKNPDGSYAKNPSLANHTFSNMFAGKSAADIIKRSCIEAGIPLKYLEKRIEKIERIPFMPQIQGPNASELFMGDFRDRLSFCTEAANKLNLEFFADEEGQIVFKIPSYNIGINRQDANNNGTKAPKMYTTETVTKYKEEKVVTGDTTAYHVVKKGDTLWDLSAKYLKDPTKWPAIYKLNKSIIKDPHWIYPGQKLLIKEGNKTTKIVKKPYTETVEKKSTNSLSELTDSNIPVIYPEHIISFGFTDSDKEVYTASQVTAEVPWINNQLQSNVPSSVTQSVADFALIQKFGFRMHPKVGTPLISDANGAAIYGALLLIRSLSNRYTGSLTIIEEPTIRVGSPIRFHLYDETPFSELYKLKEGDDNSYAQAVFYVDSISRSISPNNVSYMTLSLRAGRMQGMPSIYDKCQELYRYFYEDVEGEVYKPVKNSNQKQPSKVDKQGSTKPTGKPYTTVKGDSLWKIAAKFYGDGSKWGKIWDANKKAVGGPLTDANRVYPGQSIVIP